MACRGLRGATTVHQNSAEAIIAATRELLEAMAAANGLVVDDLACAVFTTTPDLNAAFPARAARQLGWTHTALLCTHEMDVPGALPLCIRVLLLWNTEKAASELVHVYLREAWRLRPDLASDLGEAPTDLHPR